MGAEINRWNGLTEEELRHNLQRRLHDSGAIDSAKARLRVQLLSQLKENDPRLLADKAADDRTGGEHVYTGIADGVVDDYLGWRGCSYAQSVFRPESNNSSGARRGEIERLLGMDGQRERRDGALLLELVESKAKGATMQDGWAQTEAGEEEGELWPGAGLRRRLAGIEESHERKLAKMRDDSEAGYQRRLMAVQRDAEERGKAEAEERVKRVREVEVGRVRQEEAEKRKRMVNRAREEHEREHEEQINRLRRREEAFSTWKREQNRELEREAHQKRQEIANENKRLSQRADELDQREERLRQREESLDNRERRLEERESSLTDRRKHLEEAADEEARAAHSRGTAAASELERLLDRERSELRRKESECEELRTQAKRLQELLDDSRRKQANAESELSRLRSSLDGAISARVEALSSADESRIKAKRAQHRPRSGLSDEAPPPQSHPKASQASDWGKQSYWSRRAHDLAKEERQQRHDIEELKSRWAREREAAQETLSSAYSGTSVAKANIGTFFSGPSSWDAGFDAGTSQPWSEQPQREASPKPSPTHQHPRGANEPHHVDRSGQGEACHHGGGASEPAGNSAAMEEPRPPAAGESSVPREQSFHQDQFTTAREVEPRGKREETEMKASGNTYGLQPQAENDEMERGNNDEGKAGENLRDGRKESKDERRGEFTQLVQTPLAGKEMAPGKAQTAQEGIPESPDRSESEEEESLRDRLVREGQGLPYEEHPSGGGGGVEAENEEYHGALGERREEETAPATTVAEEAPEGVAGQADPGRTEASSSLSSEAEAERGTAGQADPGKTKVSSASSSEEEGKEEGAARQADPSKEEALSASSSEEEGKEEEQTEQERERRRQELERAVEELDEQVSEGRGEEQAKSSYQDAAGTEEGNTLETDELDYLDDSIPMPDDD